MWSHGSCAQPDKFCKVIGEKISRAECSNVYKESRGVRWLSSRCFLHLLFNSPTHVLTFLSISSTSLTMFFAKSRILLLCVFAFSLLSLVNAYTCSTTCAAGTFCGQNGCTPCGQGFYSAGGSDTCHQCAPVSFGYWSRHYHKVPSAHPTFLSFQGYIQTANSASACTPCKAGTYSNNVNTACQSAQAGESRDAKTFRDSEAKYSVPFNASSLGYIVATSGQSAQTACPAGSYSPSTGLTSCTTCPCGTYATQSGSTVCQGCGNMNNLPATSPQGSTSSSQCFNCASGSYTGSDKCCNKCAAGSYSSSGSASSCTNCTATTSYSLTGSSSCSTCSVGTAPNTAHSTCTATSTAKAGSKKRGLKCSPGLMACPVSGGKTGAFECLDIATELTSCGGCWSDGTGVDCTTFDDRATASCVKGKCQCE